MPPAIVFRGERASAEVVAGYLRASGVRLVEVIPPTPYLAGPLRQAFVRVLEDRDQATRLLADSRLDVPTAWPAFPLWMRLLAALLLVTRLLVGG